MLKQLGLQVSPQIAHIAAQSQVDVKFRIVAPESSQQDQAKGNKKPATSQSAQSRNILFGNMLIVKVTPIYLKHARTTMWDST